MELWRTRTEHKKSDYWVQYAKDELMWYHLERTIIHRNGFVIDLREWRNARDECREIISEIN
jgi:hypothetical protein